MSDPPKASTCASCGASIPADHPYTWCAACGEPLPSTVTEHLRNLYTGAPPLESVPPDTGQWMATSQSVFDEAYSALLNPPRVRPSALLLVGSMAAFLVAQAALDGSWWFAAALAGVVLVHELGHYVGMRWFGYRDVQMFFVPLLGAAVSGRATSTTPWKDGVVTLLGPLPGIAMGLGLAIAMVVGNVDRAWLHELAVLLVLLNAFNLLPLGPLDGGRLLQSVLFSRHVALELAGGILGGLGLIVFAIWIRANLLIVIGIWALISVWTRYRTASAVRWLRQAHPDLPGNAAALNPDQRFALFTAARTVVPDNRIDHPPSLTGAMHTLLESFRPRPSLAVSVVLVGAWAGGLVAALAAVIVLGAYQPTAWTRHECPEMGVGAEFPTAPVVTSAVVETPVGQREALECLTAHRYSAIYSVVLIMAGVTFDEAQQLEWLNALEPGARQAARLTVDGLPAVEVTSTGPEGGRHRLVFAGSMVYRVSAFGGTSEDARRFFESFRRSR